MIVATKTRKTEGWMAELTMRGQPRLNREGAAQWHGTVPSSRGTLNLLKVVITHFQTGGRAEFETTRNRERSQDPKPSLLFFSLLSSSTLSARLTTARRASPLISLLPQRPPYLRPTMAEAEEGTSQASFLSEDNCYVALTDLPLEYPRVISRVRAPQAGAIVIFAGTRPISSRFRFLPDPDALQGQRATTSRGSPSRNSSTRPTPRSRCAPCSPSPG